MRLLITGASGFVGSQVGIRLQSHYELLGITHRSTVELPFDNKSLDLTDNETLVSLLDYFQPEVILHTAALSQVIPCENQPKLADRINTEATAHLAAWAAKNSSHLIFISTDQIFNGHRGNYREHDLPDPINHYGLSKYRAEQAVLSASPGSLVVRSNSVVGPSAGWGTSFTDRLLATFKAGNPVNLFHDQFRSPIHIRRMVDILESCVRTRLSGILHAGGPEKQSRLQTGSQLASAYGFDLSLIHSASYLDHDQSSIMHPDGSFDTSLLKDTFQHISWRPLELEFREDAARTVVS